MYAQISGARTVPLLHLEGASSSRAQRQADGSWAYRLREAGWFCDLERHAVLEEWRNPSGRKCAGFEGIPAPLLGRVQREHPDALAT